MKILLTRGIAMCMLMFLFAACSKKSWDEFYETPSTLDKPIYTVLQEKGNFSQLLSVINKAGYKTTLDAAGYWTFFAPDDDAFKAYFTEKGISGVDQLDSAQCRNIVTYSLVYYAYNKERLSDYNSSTGWVDNLGFRRRTANYTGVYDATDYSGTQMKAIANNRNGTTDYVTADYNYKYIPYFTTDFMETQGLSSYDYEYLYPGTSYTGFNVMDATVTEQDINAQNGVIHVVDKVIEALPSIDQYLEDASDYSLFNSLYQKYFVSYVYNSTVSSNYNLINGGSSQVYVK
ncbi:MAG: fasciclin domain-containing protein, partial [Niabella sp.]